MLNIGVLALQGSVEEHVSKLSMLPNVNPVLVKTREQLNTVSGLILPGGESTTIGKLLIEYKLATPIAEMAQNGMPIWGTCAGMILMARKIVGEDYTHLNLMDIAVRRNAYGSQLDSFAADAFIPEVSKDSIPLVFIRAPWVEKVSGEVQVLAKIEGRIVAVKQNNLIATSFHPELTEDLVFHRYFCSLAEKWVG